MKIRLTVVLGAVAALVFAVAAVAAPSEYKVTGGGQVLASADSSGVQGPGDTVTFQAFITKTQRDDNAEGHINVIDREDGSKTHYRGEVTCSFLVTDGTGGGYAELYGTADTKTQQNVPFVLRIRDNGQGAETTDMVQFDTEDPDTCNENTNQEDPGTFLARGNAKIHKASASQSGGSSSGTKKSSSTSTTQSTSLLSALR